MDNPLQFFKKNKAENADAAEPATAQNKPDFDLKQANLARDQREWKSAVEFYTSYLKARPNDAAILVQRGHANKELGRLQSAESDYKLAIELAPTSSDSHLQLARVYKMQRRISDAVSSYNKSLELDPSLFDAVRELQELGFSARSHDQSSLSAATDPKTVIDLSDVFFYLRHHDTVSGIQRVQLGIAKALIASTIDRDKSVKFVVGAADTQHYQLVDRAYINQLWVELAKPAVSHDDIKVLMKKAQEFGGYYQPVAGDVFLMLGAFWVLENIIQRMMDLKDKGCRVGILMHDIIPITHPEFCEASLTDTFKLFASTALNLADFILTVSEDGAQSVSRYLSKENIPHGPIRVVKSAHKTWEPSAMNKEELPSAVKAILARPYVLFVSTIEIRKNHTYLFRLWRKLKDELGSKTPKLVFVGRFGWRVSDLMAQLESSQMLNGSIEVIHSLPDNALAALYSGCLFSVFPSFVEGWGLPVGESLCFNRPCAAANVSSIPEVGGGFVDYFDPVDLNSGYECIKRLIVDRTYREERARTISQEFVPRTWVDVSRDLLKTVDALVQEAPEPVRMPVVALVPGHIYAIGHGDNMGAFVANGDALASNMLFDTRWHPIESFGRWMRGQSGSLKFRLPDTINDDISYFAEFDAVPWLGHSTAHIAVNGHELGSWKVHPGKRQAVLFRCRWPEKLIEVEIRVSGELLRGPDPRLLTIGIVSFGFVPQNDLDVRLQFLEKMVWNLRGVLTLVPTSEREETSSEGPVS